MNDSTYPSAWPVAMRYGLIASLILVIWGLITYVFDLVSYTDQSSSGNWIAQIVQYLVMGSAIFMAVDKYKKSVAVGAIGFGTAFKVGFYTALIIGIVSAIWVFIFFAAIDPSLLDQIRAGAIDQMQSNGMTSEQIEKSESFMGMFTSAPAFAIFALLGSLFVGAIISLIAAAILKDK